MKKKTAPKATKKKAPKKAGKSKTVIAELKAELKAYKENRSTEFRNKEATTVKKVVDKPKAKSTGQRVELWCYDEYNQGSIICSATDLDTVLARAQKYATETNVDNSLAAGEKDKAWEVYFPQIFDGNKVSTNMLYAGNKRDGKHYVYIQKDNKWSQTPIPTDVKIKFYLGQLNKGRDKFPWYLSDFKGREITSLTDQSLERKAILFVKVV